jgi:3D (Asp-Asp-Asp) domain-containing protein
MAALERYENALAGAPPSLQQMRSWRFTRYYVADEAAYGFGFVPVWTDDHELISRVSARFFAKLALEGTGILRDGRLVNVTGKWVPSEPDEYAEVVKVAHEYDWLPKKAGYAGLRVKEENGTWLARSVMSFELVPDARRGVGFGTIAGQPMVPFKTAATDTGQKISHDRNYFALGGVIPRGTRFWVADFVGMVLPDGSKHDGWWTANDTGGGIEGNQCDLFVGTDSLSKQVLWPVGSGRGYLWYAGIESRIPARYEFGT